MSASQTHVAGYSYTHARRRVAPLTIAVRHLREALRAAAGHAAVATIGYAIAVRHEQDRGASPEEIRALGDLHADTLAQEMESLADRCCTALGAGSTEAIAPLSWAIQEIVEWIDTSARYHGLGEDRLRLPLTWAPTGAGDKPLSLTAVVDQRLTLLQRELEDFGRNCVTRLRYGCRSSSAAQQRGDGPEGSGGKHLPPEQSGPAWDSDPSEASPR